MKWTIRRASLEDLDALAGLCRAAEGEDDYALRYLRPAVLRRTTHLALDREDRTVGMMVYHPCIDGAAWLSIARTHPDVRRQGVATALIESFADLARAAGVPALRLWTEARNRGGIASSLSAGFREIGRFSRLVAPAARGRTKAAPRRADDALWQAVEGSPIVAKGGGYVAHEWTFVPASRPVARAVAALGLFWGWEGNLLAVEAPDPIEEAISVTLWAGEPQDLFAEACRQAAAAGRRHVGTFVPHDRDLLAEGRRAGFVEESWGREAVLFERTVTPARTGRTRPGSGREERRGTDTTGRGARRGGRRRATSGSARAGRNRSSAPCS